MKGEELNESEVVGLNYLKDGVDIFFYSWKGYGFLAGDGEDLDFV